MMSTLNKERLALALGVSLPTLPRWMPRYGDEFPVVKRGSNGRAYEFELAAVSAFVDAKRQQQETERQHAKIVRTAPYRANKIVAVLGKMFALAIKWKCV